MKVEKENEEEFEATLELVKKKGMSEEYCDLWRHAIKVINCYAENVQDKKDEEIMAWLEKENML